MKNLFFGALLVGAALIGYALFSGNADLSVTDEGQKNLERAREQAEQTVDQTADSAEETLNKLVTEGKRRVHEATE